MARTISGKVTDLGGFSVKRVIPGQDARMAGPFVFFDRIGPASFDPGEGVDVRPHPHIGLSTVTYLFSGSMLHRDSLGNCLEILPGEVNWMTAGRGITHSERETLETRFSEHPLSGIQCWVALPEALAEIAPSFQHVSREELPCLLEEGLYLRLIAGEGWGISSPVRTYSPLFLADALMRPGVTLPHPTGSGECLLCVIDGEVVVGGETLTSGEMAYIDTDEMVDAKVFSRVVLMGGPRWERQPVVHWNFVSFSKARIEQARQDWLHNQFPPIAGDDKEFIPLPPK